MITLNQIDDILTEFTDEGLLYNVYNRNISPYTECPADEPNVFKKCLLVNITGDKLSTKKMRDDYIKRIDKQIKRFSGVYDYTFTRLEKKRNIVDIEYEISSTFFCLVELFNNDVNGVYRYLPTDDDKKEKIIINLSIKSGIRNSISNLKTFIRLNKIKDDYKLSHSKVSGYYVIKIEAK